MEGNKRFSICRLCLSSSDNLIHVFETKEIHGHALADVITELLRHEVSSEDIYPQCVCTNCVGKLRDFKDFKDQFITYMKLLDRAYAARHISSKEVNTKEINAQKDFEWKDENTDAMETITPDIPSLQPKINAQKDFNWKDDNTDAVETITPDIPSLQPKIELDMDVDCKSIVHNVEMVDEGRWSKRVSTGGVERSADVLSADESSDVLPRGKSSHSSIKEQYSWENLTVKQEEETSQQEGEDPLACNDSEYETFPCASEWADPEKAAIDLIENEQTVKEESQVKTFSKELSAGGSSAVLLREESPCSSAKEPNSWENMTIKQEEETSQDSGNSRDASYSIAKEGEVKRKIFQCSECGKVYKCTRSYRHHLNMHKFGKTLKCVHCDKYFANKRTLSQHMICHSDEELACNICGKTYKYKLLLRRHLCRHLAKNFKCDFCRKGFCTNADLNEHIKIHTKGSYQNHVCKICAKFFANATLFKKHKYNHKYHKSKPRNHVCSICDMKFPYPSHLAVHMRTHTKERPFSCPKCEVCVTTKYSLKCHIMSHHTEGSLTRVQCDECGNQYANVKSLKFHKKVYHMGLKEFKCHHCGQEYARKHSLKGHMKREHS